MFDLGENSTGHLLTQPDHILLGHFDMQYSKVLERHELHGPYHMRFAPVFLAVTPEVSALIRLSTIDIVLGVTFMRTFESSCRFCSAVCSRDRFVRGEEN